ncbi:MAG TPA: formate dehydrogenase accessory sulfurtransferase FdhD [Thermoleophilaceae bacterium]|nr:formate dehydrogenase accessory sulfurtransferase FdhD [Thermoleophilaceae bacterium]
MATGFDPHVAAEWIEKLHDGTRERVRDELAVEDPLEIRVDGEALAVTMRTPGDDEELAAGFLAGEGLIAGPNDIAGVGPTEDFAANVVHVRTTNGLRRDPRDERRFYLTSSCGVCGKGALEFVRQEAPEGRPKAPLGLETVLSAPLTARGRQFAFERTGGLHATGLFESTGELLAVREDVGRHNAMDKAIGSLLLAGRFPLEGVFATVSGRASFELVQKASLAALTGIVAVGPPSTLAVDLARERGMLLCGFVRAGSLNVYAGSELLAR